MDMLTDEGMREVVRKIEKQYEESTGRKFTEEQYRSVVAQVEAVHASESCWHVVIPNVNPEPE
jgi:protein-disulfide isomerase-like protein with CxxC motif